MKFMINTIEKKWIITPYKGCGEMLFGDSPDAIIEKVGQPEKMAGNQVKSTMYWDNMILSFKNNQLIQILLEHPSNIVLNNQDISSMGNLSDQFNGAEKFTNRAYTLVFDFGIAFSGYSNKVGPKTIIVFDESLKEFWTNTKRPLIL